MYEHINICRSWRFWRANLGAHQTVTPTWSDHLLLSVEHMFFCDNSFPGTVVVSLAISLAFNPFIFADGNSGSNKFLSTLYSPGPTASKTRLTYGVLPLHSPPHSITLTSPSAIRKFIYSSKVDSPHLGPVHSTTVPVLITFFFSSYGTCTYQTR